MAKKILIVTMFVLSAFLGGVLVGHVTQSAQAELTEGGEELSEYMGLLQRHTHKLGLAIAAKNKGLAEFYLHEVEETSAVIVERFPDYDGFKVGALAKAMMVPYVLTLDKAIDGGNWSSARTGFTSLVSSCNQCHQATKHSYVVITNPETNPFNQRFEP